VIPQAKPAFFPEIEDAIVDALRNDRALYGENVAKFEEEFSRMVGTRYGVSTASGTAALHFIVLSVLGPSSGKKVLTTALSFIASANAILHASGEPVFGDISYEDYCLDPSSVKAQLDKKGDVAGILPVHIYGHPADMDSLKALAETTKIPIIEDAAQSHGAKYKGRPVGSLGVAGAFSFYPTKNMTVLGDGGMVTTDDDEIARTVKSLRDGGRRSTYEHDMVGFTSRLSSVSAAVGRVQLKHLPLWNERRRAIARMYARKLSSIEEIKLPPSPSDSVEPVFHQFVIRTRDRDGLKEHLAKNGVETRIHYPIPIHLQPVYVKMYGFKEGMFPRSEAHAKECLSLPMYPFLTDDEVSVVCDSTKGFFSEK
jgi:perosamine synthetase